MHVKTYVHGKLFSLHNILNIIFVHPHYLVKKHLYDSDRMMFGFLKGL